METFSALLAICAGYSQAPGEFPAQRPVTRNFDVFFDLHPNKLLSSKQWWGWWFETNHVAGKQMFIALLGLLFSHLVCKAMKFYACRLQKRDFLFH